MHFIKRSMEHFERERERQKEQNYKRTQMTVLSYPFSTVIFTSAETSNN
jgi:hypothetical protein